MNRKLTGKWAVVIRIIAIAFSIFILYTSCFGALPNLQQRSIYAGFGLILTFALMPALKKEPRWTQIPVWDLAIIAFSTFIAIYIFAKYDWIMLNPSKYSTLDIVLGSLLILIVIEGARRSIGIAMPIITILFLLYTMFGQYIPGRYGHGGYQFNYMIRQQFLSDLGIWGSITGICATVVAMFIIFGTFLMFTGGGQSFIDLAVKVAGKYTGGPAKVAVIASSLFGMISGSAAANAATVGNFTIPLMKRLGYSSEFAGGVEATASSGGQIMPPIMGAGAFIMAELLGISYLKICLAAAIPAVLYYTSLFMGVHFYSARENMPRVPPEEMPPWKRILSWAKLGPLTLPVIVLLGLMFVGRSITYSTFWATIAASILYFFSDFSFKGMKERLSKLIDGLDIGARGLIQIVALVICANIIVCLVNLTGIGVKFSEDVIKLGHNFMLLALIGGAVVALILGMGVPTTAAYILAVTVMGPAFVKLGVLPLAAHLFIFYFAIISAITPPVCVAVYITALIAKADWLKVAWIAIKLGLVSFIVPFIFVYDNSLLFKGNIIDILIALVSSILGTTILAASVFGYLRKRLIWAQRIIFLPAAFLLIVPGWQTDLMGLALVAIGFSIQLFIRKRIATT